MFYWIDENSDLLVALEERSGDHQSYYDSSSGDHECLDKIPSQFIQWLSRHFNKKQRWRPHGGTREELRGSPKSVGFILWGPWLGQFHSNSSNTCFSLDQSGGSPGGHCHPCIAIIAQPALLAWLNPWANQKLISLGGEVSLFYH